MPLVRAQEIEVEPRERLPGQRLAPLGATVNRKLEFGEERLPEQRRADSVQRVAEEEDLLLTVVGGSDQALDEQRFVERRRDLGDEDAVVGAGVWLRAIAEVGVHRVTRFVGERAHAVEIPVEVEQHVRVNVVGAPGGVRPRALSRRGMPVDPSTLERLAQRLGVSVAQGFHGGEHQTLRRIDAVIALRPRAERTMQIEVGQRSEPERLGA